MSPARYRKYFLLTLLFGSLFRFGFMAVHSIDSIEEMGQRRGDEKYYYSIAQSLVQSGEFNEHYLKAYRPPGYPAFLALDLKLFGRSTRVVQVEQNVLYLAAMALFALTVGIALGEETALLSLLLLLTNPMWLSLPQEAYSDTLFIFFLAASLYLYVKGLRRASGPGLFLSGLLMGAATLVREIGLYFGLFMVLYALWLLWKEKKPAPGLRISGAMLVGLLIIVLPWTVRNYKIFHALVPVSTNSTINMYMGNNPKADGGFEWALPPGMQDHWNLRPDPRDEILVYRTSGKEAVQYMAAHPVHTVMLDLHKVWLMIQPVPVIASHSAMDHLYRLYRYVHWLPFMLISLYGMWLVRRERLGQIILGMCLIGVGIHMLTYFGPRYRAPFEFLLAAPAAYALAQWFTPQLRKPQSSTETPLADALSSG